MVNEENRIVVPFHAKAKARELGAIFVKDADVRGWYIPENADDSLTTALRELEHYPADEESELLGTLFESQSEEKETQSVHHFEEKHSTFDKWEELASSEDTLRIALAIREYGMPNEEQLRASILRILSLRRPGEYPVTYDGLAECSESFATLYSKERVLELIKRCSTNDGTIYENIRHADLTEEERSLMLLVLPI